MSADLQEHAQIMSTPIPPTLQHSPLTRRGFLAGALGTAAAAGLAACGGGGSSSTSSGKSAALASNAALPTKVPSGTSLAIASPDLETETAFKLSGLINKLTFKVSSWPNVAAGPDVINAMRAHSVDLAFNAGIPPIQAHYQGYEAKIVFVSQNRKPEYIFLTAPHSTIESVAQFRGKKLGFSQGQAQGVVLLRALNQAKIPYKDVDLVPLTSDEFLTSLEAKQIDIAPVSINEVPPYLDKYASEGAHTIHTNVIDLLDIAWAPEAVLQDEAKVAAIVEFLPLYAQARIWEYTHKAEWVQDYYVKTQDVNTAQGDSIVALSGKPWIPTNWNAAMKWEQVTADLLAEGGFVKAFNTNQLFDLRFEKLGYKAVPSTYWS